jgi:hypothetical protein
MTYSPQNQKTRFLFKNVERCCELRSKLDSNFLLIFNKKEIQIINNLSIVHSPIKDWFT